jgi:hypothetical protein
MGNAFLAGKLKLFSVISSSDIFSNSIVISTGTLNFRLKSLANFPIDLGSKNTLDP